jgi:hypothetical protein
MHLLDLIRPQTRRLDDRRLDRVLELADVTRPLHGAENPQRLRRQDDRPQTVARDRLRTEERRERLDVVAALVERRDTDRYDVQPIEEVGAKPPVGDRVFEIRIGGGDDADVRRERSAAPERIVAARLQQLEELGLRRQRQLAHLVEKKRAVLGRRHFAFRVAWWNARRPPRQSSRPGARARAAPGDTSRSARLAVAVVVSSATTSCPYRPPVSRTVTSAATDASCSSMRANAPLVRRGLAAQTAPRGPRRIDDRAAFARQPTPRPEVPGEDLGHLPIVGRERSFTDAPLQIQHPVRGTVAHGRAEHPFDPSETHALALTKARIEKRRGRHDGGSRGERLGDDAARDGDPHRLDLILQQSVIREPATLTARVLRVVDLEQPVRRPTDLDDRGQGIAEEALEIRLFTEQRELAIEVAFAPDAIRIGAGRRTAGRRRHDAQRNVVGDGRRDHTRVQVPHVPFQQAK